MALDNSLIGNGSSMSGIEKISEIVNNTFATARKPASTLPPFYTTIEGKMRPGLSAINLTAFIISRLGEAGINTSTLPDGSEPLMMKFIRIQNEELIKEIQLNMKGTIEIEPGTLMGMAGNIPVISSVPIQGHSINI